MFLKLMVVLTMLLSFNTFAHSVKCRLDLRPTGIWYNQCPRTMVAQGVDVWNPGPSPYPQVRVLCANPEIICETVEKDLPNEIKPVKI